MKQDNSATHQDQALSLGRPILVGAGLGLVVISSFVFGVDQPNPEWRKLWTIRPLIITPISGAMGGAFYYLMDHLSSRGSNRTAAVLLSLGIIFIGLWLSVVLGMDGTMWD